MIDKLSHWVLRSARAMDVDTEELSMIRLVGRLSHKVNEVIDGINNKTDKTGDHEGTWQGYSPVETDPGIQAVVNANTDAINVIGDYIQKFNLDELVTATVGPSGDFDTINEALEALAEYRAIFNGYGLIILNPGFVMNEQVLVRYVDMSWITITGIDAETNISRTALTEELTLAFYGHSTKPAFGAILGGALPKIDQQFYMDETGDGERATGVVVCGPGSRVEFLRGNGIRNAGRDGLRVDRGGCAKVEQCNFTDATEIGIYAHRACIINADEANVSGAGVHGFYATKGAIINAADGIANDCGQDGVYALRSSKINFSGGTANDCGRYGLYAGAGSIISASEVIATGAGSAGAYATAGGQIEASGADLSGAGVYGIRANNGARIAAVNTNAQMGAEPATTDIRVDDGSIITINGGTGGVNQTVNTLTVDGIIFKEV